MSLQRLIASLLAIVCLSACTSAPQQGAAGDARRALTEYANRFRSSDVIFGTSVFNYFGEARWSGTPGLCEADLMSVMPARKANGRMGVHSITVRTLYGVVGDTSAPTEEASEILAQESACAAVPDTRTFFNVQGEDEEALAVSGAAAYLAVIRRTACGGAPTCPADAPAVLRELAAFPLMSVRACGAGCLLLNAGDVEEHEITVWHAPGSPASIIRTETETRIWLH